MWTRYDLKSKGKQAFQRNYWSAVAVALVMAIVEAVYTAKGINSARGYVEGNASFSPHSIFWLLIAGFAAVTGIGILILGIFVGNVLLVGGCHFFVLNQRGIPTSAMLGHGFRSGNYGNVVLIMFLKDLFTRLWLLLFVIPGIIKYYEYLMIPYILGENPGMRRKEAFLISKKMMMGHKWDVFVLELSFIGWKILSMATFGVLGIFYVAPYKRATYAELYTVNREMAYQKGYIR